MLSLRLISAILFLIEFRAFLFFISNMSYWHNVHHFTNLNQRRFVYSVFLYAVTSFSIMYFH